MPLYEYKCEDCQSVTGYLRPTAQRNEPAVCSECKGWAHRILSVPQKFEVKARTSQQILHDPEVWR